MPCLGSSILSQEVYRLFLFQYHLFVSVFCNKICVLEFTTGGHAFEAVKGYLIFQPSFSEFSFAVTVKVEHSVDLLM